MRWPCAAGLVATGTLALAVQAAPLASQELSPGVHLHSGAQQGWAEGGAADVANLGLVLGQRCAAVIDTGGGLGTGQGWRERIAQITPLPVCFVINTHAHPDHVLGNAAFAGAGPGGADPQFIGHARLPRSLAARAEHDLRVVQRDLGPAHAATRAVAPTRTVAQTLELDLGGRTLHLRAWATAHTDNDLSVFDPASGTLFAGDLLFARHLPVLDGQLKGWLKTMDDLAALPVKQVVPGHGEPSTDWPAALGPQRRYLSGLAASVREAIAKGWTLGETLERLGEPGNPEWLLTNLFHKRNLSAAFAELEWEN